jgi:hypothetical protein
MPRACARNTNQHLTGVARGFVEGAAAGIARRPGASRASTSRTN